mmetsp:Transcript_15543/g.22105  ORF Transcript_15543/g.22105 Transcript_15543/m.22105 type:complete len:336 (+) Transcript_15543:138-1145(+)
MSSTTTTDIVLMFLSSGWYFIIAGAIIRSIYLCLRRTFCGYEEERISVEEEEEQETPERYWTLSHARKEEIDNKREAALLRYLNRFTLTLGDEHLLCCSGSQTDSTLSSSTSEINDEGVTLDECCADMERNNDLEEGNKDIVVLRDGADMAQAQDSKQTETAAGDAAVEYTHISIPVPGCDVTGIDISTALEKRRENRRRWKLPFLFQTGKDNRNGKETSQIEKNATNNKTQQNDQQKVDKMVEKRNVPIFCAICLSEYDKGDGVCWSSNAECSHVFHEDCILQWLISSGKKRAMSQYFTKHPTDAKLLENEFCPCCRQEFICVKPALLGSEESV